VCVCVCVEGRGACLQSLAFLHVISFPLITGSHVVSAYAAGGHIKTSIFRLSTLHPGSLPTYCALREPR
jgi:hypothetical protein